MVDTNATGDMTVWILFYVDTWPYSQSSTLSDRLTGPLNPESEDHTLDPFALWMPLLNQSEHFHVTSTRILSGPGGKGLTIPAPQKAEAGGSSSWPSGQLSESLSQKVKKRSGDMLLSS